jgi:hypothetical protein
MCGCDKAVQLTPAEQSPGACDTGDAFWVFLLGLGLGTAGTLVLVNVTNEKTVRGIARKAFGAAKRTYGK